MLKNHFKIAFRSILKSKTFSLINIVGITIGITSFLLIALYVFDELTFDSFHKNADNIFRVVNNKTSPEGRKTKIAGAGYQVSERAKAEFPEINGIARLTTLGRANLSTTDNMNTFNEDLTLGSPGLLTVFDFKLLQGNRSTALSEPHSVVVTEKTALKFFNTTEVLGKVLKMDDDAVPFKVTGVLKDFPDNSSISFNLVYSESSITDGDFVTTNRSDWSSDEYATYITLNNKADAGKVADQLTRLTIANQDPNTKQKSVFTLQPIKDIHFHSDDVEGNTGAPGNITYIYVFSVIGLFVLFIACINYTNLTTARFANRAREIAVRKVVGASRKNLAAQFLSEAFLTTFFALLISLVITRLLLPEFNAFTGKSLNLGLATDYRILAGILLVLIITSLLSGLYPALYQSGLKPLSLLKNKINIGQGSVALRRYLVVFQFTLSIVMIAVTIIVYMQINFISNKDMGFKKDHLLVIDINSGDVRRGAETIKNEFARLPQVNDVSVSSRVPGEWKNLPKIKVRKESAILQDNDMYFIGADDNFIKTYQVALTRGRNFLPNASADSTSVLINETAAKELGITELSGQTITIPSANYGNDFSPLKKPFVATVVGIVKDFNFKSLREPVAPMVIGTVKNRIQKIDYFTARLKAGNDISGTLKQMDAILRKTDQTHLLEYHFLDKQWDLFYRQDNIRQTIFFVIAGLTILISCLGLLGLSIFTAEQRIKEIGIRKVLGAGINDILIMLSKDIVKLILVSALIATPIAWYAMYTWLTNFAYRIQISWWVFCIAGGLTVLIAIVTISVQAIKAAVANPVNSLRSE